MADEQIRELVDGMRSGDPRATAAFFTFVAGLKAKKLGKDGERALTLLVNVVELFLPPHTRTAYVAASDQKKKRPARGRKRVASRSHRPQRPSDR
jgi:hypothetical protein